MHKADSELRGARKGRPLKVSGPHHSLTLFSFQTLSMAYLTGMLSR